MKSALGRFRTWALTSLAATSVLASCDDGPVNADAAAVDTVIVAPRTATLAVGNSLSLSADVLDANGQPIPSINVAWSSENSAVAEVSSTGVVTAISTGTVRIAASSWGKNDVATITVSPTITVLGQVGRIVIAPSNPRVDEGQSLQLAATVLDVQDRVITGLTITWSSSNTSRATVDNTGLVRGISAGTVNIVVSAGGKTASTTLRVDKD